MQTHHGNPKQTRKRIQFSKIILFPLSDEIITNLLKWTVQFLTNTDMSVFKMFHVLRFKDVYAMSKL